MGAKGKIVAFAITILAFFGVMALFEVKDWPVGSGFAGILIGILYPYLEKSVQDVWDTTDWKKSQRKLMRAGDINKETLIRVSFAYLFRIKVGNEYLLVKNERGTGKYQPVGGVYQLSRSEKTDLKNLYKVKDDDKIPIDESSKADYRLRIENKYLRKFVRRFDKKAKRERINDLSREFKEETIEKGIIRWDTIKYRYCGRHMTTIHYSQHFQTYELLLADIVELIPTKEQEKDLKALQRNSSGIYRFATAKEIQALGIDTDKGRLDESISDHTMNILQETEGELMASSDVGRVYSVRLH